MVVDSFKWLQTLHKIVVRVLHFYLNSNLLNHVPPYDARLMVLLFSDVTFAVKDSGSGAALPCHKSVSS